MYNSRVSFYEQRDWSATRGSPTTTATVADNKRRAINDVSREIIRARTGQPGCRQTGIRCLRRGRYGSFVCSLQWNVTFSVREWLADDRDRNFSGKALSKVTK